MSQAVRTLLRTLDAKPIQVRARNAVQGGTIERAVRWAERHEHIAASRARPRFSQVLQNGVADIST